MSAGTCGFFCLICALLATCAAQTAYLGQNFTLPCKYTTNKYSNITLMKWSRLDLGPDSYIFLYKDGRFHPDKQIPSYKGRAYLQDMEARDFSLVLINVTIEDRGRYECDFIEEGRNEASRTTITNTLDVVEPETTDENTGDGGNKTGVIVGSVVGVILLLLAVVVGFLIYRRHMKKNQNLQVLPEESAAEQML